LGTNFEVGPRVSVHGPYPGEHGQSSRVRSIQRRQTCRRGGCTKPAFAATRLSELATWLHPLRTLIPSRGASPTWPGRDGL